MKKQLLLFAMILLPLVASAYDIEVKNADGKTIYYNYINNGTELEVTYGGMSPMYGGNVVIPEEVTYMNRTRKVTSIGIEAFSECKGLLSVIIPNSVTSIESSAFRYCSGLTYIKIGDSVTSIGGSAFSDCSKLTSITIPNTVTSIGNSAFYNCSGLTYIKIGDSVTSIGGSAFEGCSKLNSVNIPNSVTSIGSKAFEGCSGLTIVSITDIAAWCKISFYDASSNPLCYAKHLFVNGFEITDLVIPNSVTSIGYGAFYNCSGLTSVTIPNNVTSIGSKAFEGADIPTVISLIENPFTIKGKTSDSRTFSKNTFINATLYVPKGTIEKYKATDGWKDFVFIEEGTGGGDTPTTQKCEKPTISYENGKLTFTSETEGAVCQYSITDTDIKAGSGNEVQLTVTYNISVYATKLGYENSETATATLCWINQQPKTEGITNGIANISAQAVLIQSEGGSIKVQGVDEGTQVNVYSVNGTQAGSAISQSGAATINTNLQPGSIAIVKIGQKSVKVVMK